MIFSAYLRAPFVAIIGLSSVKMRNASQFFLSATAGTSLNLYGYQNREDPGCVNFSGIHSFGGTCNATGLRLVLTEFNERTGQLADLSGAVCLLDSQDQVAAGWKYRDLLAHWKKKHRQAAYIPSLKKDDELLQYRYGSKVRLGTGTDFLMLIRAIAAGVVYYDPGIKGEDFFTAKPKFKKRSQFRIKSSSLERLYEKFETVDVCE